MSASIALPRMMHIGGGAVGEVGAVLARLGVKKPLVVTDSLMEELGNLGRVLDILKDAGFQAGVFSETVPDPTASSIYNGRQVLVDGGFDSIVALGGGSPIDTAKALAVLAVNGGAMSDYKAPRDVTEPALPVIAIPTTAGTGSEATQFTIITDDQSNEKMLCKGLSFLPVAALVDFELTLTMPLRLTADTGIDSLTHAIEAYVSKRANPFSDGMALAAMKAITANIRTVCADPNDRAAREAMMLGATQAGIAFSNASVCLVHGMSRPIGAFFHVPHGLSNAMLLPAVTEFSAQAALSRYADCARTMAVAAVSDDDTVATTKLVTELRRLNADLNVPTPKGHGIDEQEYFSLIPTMAQQALASGSPGNNPRVPTEAEITDLYAQAWN